MLIFDLHCAGNYTHMVEASTELLETVPVTGPVNADSQSSQQDASLTSTSALQDPAISTSVSASNAVSDSSDIPPGSTPRPADFSVNHRTEPGQGTVVSVNTAGPAATEEKDCRICKDDESVEVSGLMPADSNPSVVAPRHLCSACDSCNKKDPLPYNVCCQHSYLGPLWQLHVLIPQALIKPCKCTGSMQFVHRSCLDRSSICPALAFYVCG